MSTEQLPADMVVDRSCSDSACKGRGTYDLRVLCFNCGRESTIRKTKGHALAWSDECPNCGCSRLSLAPPEYKP